MEQSFEIVAQKCGQQLNDFQRCTLAHRSEPDGGASSCAVQRTALSTCAADAVPLVATIKQRCGAQIRAYDACLNAGKNDDQQQITERCSPALRQLWQCTEAVKREEMIKSGQIPGEGQRSV